MLLEIETYFHDDNAQAVFLFRDYDDVYWTDDRKELVEIIKQELKRIEEMSKRRK